MGLDRRELLGVAAGAVAGAYSSAHPASAADRSALPKTVAVEEACLPVELIEEWRRVLGRPFDPPRQAMLQDFLGVRLSEMDRYGIEMSVVSLTVPGPQGDTNPVTAHAMAKKANDAIASAVNKRPDRFAAFGGLAMHDVDAACREFERAVRELGLRGVMLNGFQHAGPDGETAIFYDDRRFDPFWATAQSLGAPVYLHPGLVGGVRDQDFAGFQHLSSAAWGFAINNGLHALRIITAGVFDRHPGAQLILGHMGEHIVYDMWRIDNRLKVEPFDYAGSRSVRSYFQSNLHISTSGEFTSPGLRHAISEIGAERIMFAVDYPFEANKAGAEWFASAPLSADERHAIARGNAIRLLKLPLTP